MVCFIVIKTGEILVPQNKCHEVSLHHEISYMLQHAWRIPFSHCHINDETVET